MRYRLVIWDFDGTLADTLSLALDVYNGIAKEKGFRLITNPMAVRDMSMSEFLSSHGIAARRVPLTFSRFLAEVRRQSATLPLHEGITEVVRKIQALGVRQGIVSSNSTQNITDCIETHGLLRCFSFVTGTSRIFGKERRIRKAIRDAGVDANQVLYVGDEIRDIEAGRAAHVEVAAVTWGLNSMQALSKNNPRWLIESPAQLLATLQAQ